MEIKYCFIVNISHPDECDENYAVSDYSQVGDCIRDYIVSYQPCIFSEPLNIHITQVVWKGGIEGEKKNEK